MKHNRVTVRNYEDGRGFYLIYAEGNSGGARNATPEDIARRGRAAYVATCLKTLQELPVEFYKRRVDIVFEKGLVINDDERQLIEATVRRLEAEAKTMKR